MKFGNSGEFTFISSLGCSIIDYILVSPSFWPLISDFEIGTLILNDHLPLMFSFDFNGVLKLTSDQEMDCMPRVVRSPELSQRILQLFKSILDLSSALVNSSDHLKANFYYEHLISFIINSLHEQPEVKNINYVNYIPKHQWFDKECKNLKIHIRTIYWNLQNSLATHLPVE